MGAILRNNVVYSGGGGSSDIKELTQEEYNALSEEEKNNGTLYCVPDGTGVVTDDLIFSVNGKGILCVTYDDGIEETTEGSEV